MIRTPTLSICIPTYNRAELLASALGSVAPQVAALAPEAELLVSDNCSTDRTRETVEGFAARYPVRYHRNAENVGAIRNITGLVEIARGEFCWIIGDDEMLRPGAVEAVVRAVRAHADLDYFYVNYSIDEFGRRAGLSVTADDFREWTRTGNPNTEERRVGRWETLIGEDFSALTPIYCSVFRRSVWLGAAGSLSLSPRYSDSVLYSTVEETFPHSVIFARTMMGRPAWASGYPWVVMCGTESWSDFIPVVVLRRFHELLDLYVGRGADPALVEQHRRRMLTHAEEPLGKYLRGESLPRLEGFDVAGFAARHYRYAELWGALYRASAAAPLVSAARRSAPAGAFAVFAKLFSRSRQQWARLRARSGPSTPTISR